MLRKKIILLGAPAVGKTSLVARWVRGIFSDRYLTTIGVKIEKKTVLVGESEVTLQIWDLAGEISIKGPALAYIRGADGCLLVVDGTRKETLWIALALLSAVTKEHGPIPTALALNKTDLRAAWEITAEELENIESRGLGVVKTSAKSGDGVEQAFNMLASMTLAPNAARAAS